MPSVRIAHLTDLHCDGSTDWNAQFANVRNCLAALHPDIVLITGDCVNHPKKSLFLRFASSLTDLCTDLDAASMDNFSILTIPGNHDRFIFGNKVPLLFNRSRKFDHFLPILLYPRETSVNELVRRIFKRYGIALFPIDSTNPGTLFAFAQGRVPEPSQLFGGWKQRFLKWSTDASEYSTSIKIVLLHHHVVPLPADKVDEQLEPFNLIQNPFQFLHAAAEHNVDLILHGHRHVSGISQLKLLSSQNSRPITISACGSSGKIGLSQPIELKIVDITDNKAVVITSFTTEFGIPTLSKRHEHSIRDYGETRRRRNGDITLYDAKFTTNVIRVKRRTKLIKIEQNNMCEIHYAYGGVEWKPDTSNFTMYETITSEAGRLIRAGTILSDTPQRTPARLLSRAQLTKSPASPHTPERVELEIVSPRALDANALAFCSTRAILHNVYALTTTQFEECYPIEAHQKEETSRTAIGYPTDECEIILKFPGPELFPHPASFHVEAFETATSDVDDPWNTMERRYVTRIHADETKYIKDIGALRVRQELHEVVLTIPHPQPGLTYTLRWEVVVDNPKNVGAVDTYRNIAAALAKEFLDDQADGPRQFYEEVKSSIRANFSITKL